MDIIANSRMSLSSFSNLLPSSVSVRNTVKRTAILALALVAALPTTEGVGLGLSILKGMLAAYPHITYAACVATCLGLQENPPPFWSYQGCVRSCEFYRNSF